MIFGLRSHGAPTDRPVTSVRLPSQHRRLVGFLGFPTDGGSCGVQHSSDESNEVQQYDPSPRYLVSDAKSNQRTFRIDSALTDHRPWLRSNCGDQSKKEARLDRSGTAGRVGTETSQAGLSSFALELMDNGIIHFDHISDLFNR